MKLKLLFSFLLALGTVVADEAKVLAETAQDIAEPVMNEPEVKQEFGYFSAGLGGFPTMIPVFSGGYRIQSGHHGVDLSVSVSTVVSVTGLSANLLYHHYFKPSLTSQFYVGGGVSPGVLFGASHLGHVGISPQFVFGKQYRNESNDLRFFQMQVDFPGVFFGANDHWDRVNVSTFPVMTLSYGIGF